MAQLRHTHIASVYQVGEHARQPFFSMEFCPGGSLDGQLILLRRDRGGSALIVVTGRLEPASIPMIAALRRRFDRVILTTLVARPPRMPVYPGLTMVAAASAPELALAWNTGVAR